MMKVSSSSAELFSYYRRRTSKLLTPSPISLSAAGQPVQSACSLVAASSLILPTTSLSITPPHVVLTAETPAEGETSATGGASGPAAAEPQSNGTKWGKVGEESSSLNKGKGIEPCSVFPVVASRSR